MEENKFSTITVDKWKGLIPDNNKKARDLYLNEIFPYIQENFCNTFEEKALEIKKFKYFISIIGSSPYPAILFLKAIKPVKVLFICCEDTEQNLDLIYEKSSLRLSQIEKVTIDRDDAINTTYKAIKNFCNGYTAEEIFIDTTSEKKAMVAGAMLAASILNITTGYVDYKKYLPYIPEPEPGTEIPYILSNPLNVFGEIELREACQAFNQGNYPVALEIAQRLEERVPDVWPARKLIDLIKIYQSWEAFDFKKAFDSCKYFLIRYKNEKNSQKIDLLRKHCKILKILSGEENDDFHINLTLNFYYAGIRCARYSSRYDFSVLLMYRTIEQVFTYCLKKEGINPEDPVYPPLCTKENYNKKIREIFENQTSERDLPRKLALMDQAIILNLTGHEILEPVDLKKLKTNIELRNLSLLAHGIKPMTESHFKKIRRKAAKILDRLLKIENKGYLSNYKQIFQFPKIDFYE